MISHESSPASGHRWWYFGVATAVLVVTCVLRPSVTWRAEAWAEIATNFYHHARYSSWWDAIIACDYGSLAWPLRLVSQLLVAVFGLDAWFVWTVQMLAAVGIAAAAASLCLPAFDRFGVDIRARAVLAFAIGAGAVADYECYAAINAVYFAAIPMLAWSIRLFDRSTSVAGSVWRGVLIGLMMTGKVQLLVFAPLMGIAFLWNIMDGRRRASLGPAIACVFSVFQVAAALLYPSDGIGVPDHKLAQIGKDALAHTTAAWWYVITGVQGRFPWIIFGALAVVGIIAMAWRRRDDRWWLGAMSMLITATVLVAAINARSFPYIDHHLSLSTGYIPDQSENRHFILLQIFALLAVVLVIRAWAATVTLPAAIVLSLVAFQSRPGNYDFYSGRHDSPSDWARTIGSLPTVGAIPINPDGWWYDGTPIGGVPGPIDGKPASPDGWRYLARKHLIVMQVDLPSRLAYQVPSDLSVKCTGAVVLAHTVRHLDAPVRLEIASTDGNTLTVPAETTPGRIFQTFSLPKGMPSGATIRLLAAEGYPLPINRISLIAKPVTE